MKAKELAVKQIEWFDDRFYRVRFEALDKTEQEGYLPSVTTKLGALAKPNLYRWYGDLGTREAIMRRDEAANRGSRIHWAWACMATGGGVIYNNPLNPIYTIDELAEVRAIFNGHYVMLESQDEMYDVMKLKSMIEIVKPQITASEQVVYDLNNREAGTLDNVFQIKQGSYSVGRNPLVLTGGQYIFDLKTGKSVGKDAKMQVAAYAYMVEAMGLGKVAGALIGHTSANTRTGIEGFSLIHVNRAELDQEYSDFRDIARVWDRNFGTLKPTIRQIPGVVSLQPIPIGGVSEKG